MKISIHIGLFVFLLSFHLSSFAQQKNTTIQLVDSVFLYPVSGASVYVKNPQTGQLIQTLIADVNGSFVLNAIEESVLLEISALGYQPQTIAGIPALLPDQLLLSSLFFDLQEVEVKYIEKLIEIAIDKTVYNASADPLNLNLSALDVLRNTPMVQVDDRLITIKGHIPIILLNNREHPMLLNNPGNFLATQPASFIKRVELVTVPSVKYDGRPVINLVVGEVPKYKYNGTIQSEITESASITENISGNIAFDKFSSNLGVTGKTTNNRNQKSESFSENKLIDQIIQSDISSKKSSSNDFSGYYMGNYDFNSNHSLKLSSHASSINIGKTPKTTTLTSYSRKNGDVVKNYEMSNRTPEQDNDLYSAMLNYEYKFKSSSEKILTFFYMGSWMHSKSLTESEIIGKMNYPDKTERNKSRLKRASYNLNVNYFQAIKEKGEMNFGLSYTHENRIQKNALYSLNDENILELTDDYTNQTNTDDDAFVAFFSFQWKFSPRFMLNVGGKTEYTFTCLNDKKEVAELSDDYIKFTPTITTTFLLKDQSKLTLSYTMNSKKPSLLELNPTVEKINENNYHSGNPHLKPMKIHRFSLNLDKTFGTRIQTMNSLEISRETDGIVHFSELSGDSVFFSSYKNAENSFYIRFFSYESFSFLRNKWRLGFQFFATYVHQKKENDTSTGGLQTGGNINLSFTPNPKFSFSGRISILPNQIGYQERNDRLINHSFKLNYIPDSKWSFTLSANNPLQPTIHKNQTIDTDSYYSRKKFENNIFSLLFSVQFRFQGDVRKVKI